MDLIVILILMVLVLFFFRKFSSFIYFKVELTTGVIYDFINQYVPANIEAVLANYSSGLLYTILLWAYVLAMIIFEFYIIRIFFRRR